MPLACIWTKRARQDIHHIEETIAKDSPKTSVDVVIHILRTVEDTLSRHPHLGRPGRNPRSRELILAGLTYVVAYRIHTNRIEVLRVIHTAQKWPRRF